MNYRDSWVLQIEAIFSTVIGFLNIDLRVCDDGELVHILCSWTLSIVSSLSKILTKHNVSQIRFYLRLQVNPTQLGPIDRASPYLQEHNVCS
jgi:hypothetical protein